LADVAEGGAREADGAGEAAEVAFHEGDAGAFDGDVGAGAHGDADIGGGEGGGVVDAVAGHGDAFAGAFQLLDEADFVGGCEAGFDAIEAEREGDGVGGGAVVAGGDDDFDAEGVEGGDGVAGGFLDWVGEGEQTGGLIVDGDGEDGFAGGLERIDLCAERVGERDGLVGEEGGFADVDAVAVDEAGDAGAGGGVEIGGGEKREVSFAGGADDAGGERVFGGAFDGGGELEELRVGLLRVGLLRVEG